MPDIRTMVTPTHLCGCTGRPQRDNEAGRAMAAAFALVRCWTCQRVEDGMAASLMAETLQLPDLDGSVKQVAYATTVREQIRQRIEAAYPDPDSGDMAATDAVLYGITDSRWWLDRKDAEAYDVLRWVRPIVAVVESRRAS